jgi:hypothetical protein
LVKKRRPLLHMLLSLLLLLSQQAAFAHWVAHGVQGRHLVSPAADKTAVPTPGKSGLLQADQLCQECLFMAQVGSVPISTTASPTIDLAGNGIIIALPAFVVLAQNPSPFLSRAPPVA